MDDARPRGRAKPKAEVIDRAQHELTRKRLETTVERERKVAFSAHIDGRPFL